MPYQTALEKFQAAIIGQDAGLVEDFVRPKSGMSAADQLAVYIDGYGLRLEKAVMADYPCLAAYLGKAEASSWIGTYIKATPSRSYSLDFYPFGFWRFLRTNHPSAAIGDLAELEGAIAETFLAPGSTPLTRADMANVSPELFGKFVFRFRPASRLLRLSHDAETVFAAFKRNDALDEIPARPTFLYVHRHDNEIKRRLLTERQYDVLRSIADRQNFEDMVNEICDEDAADPTDVLSLILGWLGDWLDQGFFANPQQP